MSRYSARNGHCAPEETQHRTTEPTHHRVQGFWSLDSQLLFVWFSGKTYSVFVDLQPTSHQWFLLQTSPHRQLLELISDLTASRFSSCWKSFISFPTTLLGKLEFVSRGQFFHILFILPVNANKRPTLQELSYLQTPQGVSQKSIWPKTIKYKFTWYKHRMTAEISPPTSALHGVHTNDSRSGTNYLSPWKNLKVRRICKKRKANKRHL